MKTLKKQIHHELTEIYRELSSPEPEILKEEETQDLPAPVRRWLRISGAIGQEKTRTVWLEQKFQMKLKPEQKKWSNAIARQVLTVEPPAFLWAVRMKAAPLLQVTGRDKFFDGKGEIQMKLNGLINLGRNSGEKIDEGTLQRYLGETIWFPSALLSRAIKWEIHDEFSAKATMTCKGSTGTGTFHFNREGYFEKFTAWRYKDNDAGSERLKWTITAKEFSDMNGILIPVKCEGTWMLDSGPWTWCNIEVTAIKYNQADLPMNLL